MSGISAQACPLDDGIDSRLAIVCSFVCTCNIVPNIGNNGQQLKQSCVDAGLQQHNKRCDTSIRQQVFYNTRPNPPAPLLEKDADGEETIQPLRNFGHALNRVKKQNIATAIAAGMSKDKIESYTRGDMRIPDAVVLKDTNGKPTQDNLMGVIEVKFPPDDWGDGQEKAYEEIAGDEDKLHLLTPEADSCACDGAKQTGYEDETQPQPAEVTYRDRLEEQGYPVEPEEDVNGWWGIARNVGRVAARVAIGVVATVAGS